MSSSAVSHCISSVFSVIKSLFSFFFSFLLIVCFLKIKKNKIKNQPLYQSLGCDAFEPWQVNVTLMLKCGD